MHLAGMEDGGQAKGGGKSGRTEYGKVGRGKWIVQGAAQCLVFTLKMLCRA